MTEAEARRKLVPSKTTPLGLRRDDTIASVLAAHEQACSDSRADVADLDRDAELTGRDRPVVPSSAYLPMVRELAHHCGHADILREQVLAARGA